MVAWIFSDETYTEQYHQVYEEFLRRWFTEGRFDAVLNQAVDLISPYVEKDPTKFCTYEEFETGVAALREFCRLRALSVTGQLTGSIPSTSEEQSARPEALIDPGDLNLSDMGNMGGMGGKDFRRDGEARRP